MKQCISVKSPPFSCRVVGCNFLKNFLEQILLQKITTSVTIPQPSNQHVELVFLFFFHSNFRLDSLHFLLKGFYQVGDVLVCSLRSFRFYLLLQTDSFNTSQNDTNKNVDKEE